jgi:hypothetical protein
MNLFRSKAAGAVILLALAAGCQKNVLEPESAGPTAMKEVPAVRLNYRYEPDVPPPEAVASPAAERNAAVQAHFDQNRTQEILDTTITSPDGAKVLAVYHNVADLPSEFRLDMYTADGQILRRITADSMAVHFPDSIRWAPDSSTVAFVAMIRGVPAVDPSNTADPNSPAAAGTPPANSNASTEVNANTNTETDAIAAADANVDANAAVAPTEPTPEAPVGVLTFRTEQIYICNADGGDVKPLTQNEGLIYFYYVWSPDSTMLAALAATAREWHYLNQSAELKGEIFVPVGRPRLVEKNGRERRLDDGLTAVQPVWSPDSAKIAAGFDTQVRIYDAGVNAPTQAAIPLRNHLLLSSQAYDRDQQTKLNAVNTAPDANMAANAGNANTNTQPSSVLPDPNTLVSFNPIIALNWTANDLLYFQTAFVKRMKNEADSAMSFPRWHRLVLSPQPMPGAN